MPDSVYLTLPDDVGVAPPFIVKNLGGKKVDVPNPKAGEPEPLNDVGIPIPVPVMVDGELLQAATTVYIRKAPALGAEGELADKDGTFKRARIIPGTRVIETDHPAVVNELSNSGYLRCDPPASEQARKPKSSDKTEEV